MAMTVGSVSIADDGTETKSGFAGAYYDNLKALWTTKMLTFGPIPTDPVIVVPALRSMAEAATSQAFIITYILANAKAEITTGDGGLQRTPNPNNADTATQAPLASKYLSIV
jgi:hypothetical protein